MASLFLTNCGLLVERFATYGNLLGIPLQIGHEETFVSGLITHGLDPSYCHTLEQVLQRTRRGFDKGPWIPLGPLADLDTALARLVIEKIRETPVSPGPESIADIENHAAWTEAAKLTLERELGPGVIVGKRLPDPADPIDLLEPGQVKPATRLALLHVNSYPLRIYYVGQCYDVGLAQSRMIERTLLDYLQTKKDSLPRYQGVKLLDMNQTAFRYEISGRGIFWFRTGGDTLQTQAVRKTYVAAWLNEQLCLNTVPRAHFAIIPDGGLDRLGVLSEEAPGEEPPYTGLLQDNIHSDLVAFEFLVGNADVIPRNMRGLRVFDHSEAFVPGLIKYAPQLKVAGTHLPRHYNPHFIEALKDLDGIKIQDGVGQLLTDLELYALLLRRDIILADVELRRV